MKSLAQIPPRNSLTNTIFFLCDIQPAITSKIWRYPAVESVAQRMIKTSRSLGIPLVVTEQYPKAFKPTVKELSQLFEKDQIVFEKTQFSMLTEDVMTEISKYPARKNIVIFGIEAHICVLQTTLDLLERDYNVFLLSDGISSMTELDRTAGLKRMEQSGAVISTSQSVIFEILKDKNNPKFKEMLPLLAIEIKEMPPHL